MKHFIFIFWFNVFASLFNLMVCIYLAVSHSWNTLAWGNLACIFICGSVAILFYYGMKEIK